MFLECLGHSLFFGVIPSPLTLSRVTMYCLAVTSGVKDVYTVLEYFSDILLPLSQHISDRIYSKKGANSKSPRIDCLNESHVV